MLAVLSLSECNCITDARTATSDLQCMGLCHVVNVPRKHSLSVHTVCERSFLSAAAGTASCR